jgi:hypothetical protein
MRKKQMSTTNGYIYFDLMIDELYMYSNNNKLVILHYNMNILQEY